MIDRPPRRSTVIIGIITAIILFVAMFSLLLMRSLAGREPTHVAIVKGNERWLGAEVTVAGPNLAKPYVARLDRTGHHSIPFFVPPGEYALTVRANGIEAFALRFELGEVREVQINLPAEGPPNAPPTQPAR